MKKLLKTYALNSNNEYFEMIIDNFTNRQKKQAIEQFKAMPKRYKIEFFKAVIIGDFKYCINDLNLFVLFDNL